MCEIKEIKYDFDFFHAANIFEILTFNISQIDKQQIIDDFFKSSKSGLTSNMRRM